MTLKPQMHPIGNLPKAWRLVALLLLACGLKLYGQQVDLRSAAAAKAEAGRAALIYTAADQIQPATASGAFITLDAPGEVQGTGPASINNGGVITGFYSDNVGSGSHGFVRTQNGTFVSFDVPGAVTGTFPPASTMVAS